MGRIRVEDHDEEAEEDDAGRRGASLEAVATLERH